MRRCYRITFEHGPARDMYFESNRDAVIWALGDWNVRAVADPDGVVIYQTEGDMTLGKLAIMVGLCVLVYAMSYWLLDFYGGLQ
jgi:hypothetical protein